MAAKKARKKDPKAKDRMTAHRNKMKQGGRVLVGCFPLEPALREKLATRAAHLGQSIPETVSSIVKRALR